jgi:CRP-like cAMP-binding protein
MLTEFPQFNSGDATVRVLEFARGEMLLVEGDTQQGLRLIVQGEAILRVAGTEIERLRPGDFYGEHSVLAGQPSQAALLATVDTRVIEFDLESSRKLVEQSAPLARTVGETIDRRRRAVQAARKAGAASA